MEIQNFFLPIPVDVSLGLEEKYAAVEQISFLDLLTLKFCIAY